MTELFPRWVFFIIFILYNFSVSPSNVWTPLWEYVAHLSGDFEKSKKDGEECQVGWRVSAYWFGGAYVRRKICVSKSIGLACSGKEIYHFCFVLLCIRGQIPSTSPPGTYIWRGDLTEGFLRYDFGGLIFGGAYFRNYTDRWTVFSNGSNRVQT